MPNGLYQLRNMKKTNDYVTEDLLRLITDKLDGTIEYRSTFSSTGRQSKKIIIEYDVSS